MKTTVSYAFLAAVLLAVTATAANFPDRRVSHGDELELRGSGVLKYKRLLSLYDIACYTTDSFDAARLGAAPLQLEVVYRRDGEQIARNVQPLQIEPGKFSYRLVRGEIDFDDYGTVEAHCRIGPDGPATIVPYTLLPPDGDGS